MELTSELREQIEGLIKAERVVLFMKGRRGAPQCGFSATVCRILDGALPHYETVNVLEDAALREGIKVYSDWPTVPQLYVKGEFVGGCDIVQQMSADGSLYELLEVQQAAPGEAAPALQVTPAAAALLQRALAEQPEGQALHLRIDARMQHELHFGPAEPGEHVVESEGVTLHLDPLSASRAEGVQIDASESEGRAVFRISNPGANPGEAPGEVRSLTPAELQSRLNSDTPPALYDVRTPEERSIAHIEGARLLDAEAAAALEQADRETPLVFHCHHGGRSLAAAEHFAQLGFRNVWNLTGGIDAWSREVDPKVPRYDGSKA